MNIQDCLLFYDDTVTAMSRAGIIKSMPGSGLQQVIGFDRLPYPAPKSDQIERLFDLNHELIEQKMRQGFTQLLITPLAAPIPVLIDRLSEVIRSHARSGTIYHIKTDPTGTVTPAQVNTKAPTWLWERVQRVLDTDRVVYFPQVYTPQGHQGMSKSEAVTDRRICAIPGWSISLVEPLVFLPKAGQAEVIGGRRQLENGLSPREYLSVLSDGQYAGESGWTLEDFLTYFLIHLEKTHQVTHDRADNNALWLLGQYLPDLEKTPNLVPVGYWSSTLGKKLYLSAHRTGNHFKMCGARTMVRLPG